MAKVLFTTTRGQADDPVMVVQKDDESILTVITTPVAWHVLETGDMYRYKQKDGKDGEIYIETIDLEPYDPYDEKFVLDLLTKHDCLKSASL